MKLIKLLLIIVFSFSLGIWTSRVLLEKKDVSCSPEVEDDHKEDVSCSSEVEANHSDEENELELSKESQDLIGLKTEKIKQAYFNRKISVIGHIAQDPESSSHVTVPASGVLSECRVNIGSAVKKDETLCIIKNGDSLIEIQAPSSGVVISNSFKAGDKVDTVSSMHTIFDLSKLWVTLDVYEKDIADVKLGQMIFVQSIAFPSKTFLGEITFISPRVDKDTHAIKVRALVQNPDYLLKLGMFINAEILVESQDKYIVIPSEALHFIGENRVVFIKTEEGKFQIRVVKIKDQTKDEIAVYEGLNEGEHVVVEGGFLLKSEFLKSQMGEGCAE